jgi:hypothetical protein
MQKFGDLAGQIFGHDALPAPFWQRATAYSRTPWSSIAFGPRVRPSTSRFFSGDEAIGSRFPPFCTGGGIQSIAGFLLAMMFGDFVD